MFVYPDIETLVFSYTSMLAGIRERLMEVSNLKSLSTFSIGMENALEYTFYFQNICCRRIINSEKIIIFKNEAYFYSVQE